MMILREVVNMWAAVLHRDILGSIQTPFWGTTRRGTALLMQNCHFKANNIG